MVDMLSILNYFWQICLLKRGAERIPPRTPIFSVIFLIYVLTNTVGGLIARPFQSVGLVLVMVIIEVLVFSLITLLLLYYKNFPKRFISTCTALLGAGAFIVCIQIPFMLLRQHSDIDLLIFFSQSVWLVCLIWWLAIVGNLYHRSAQISMLQGSAIAFMNMILIATVILVVLPPPQTVSF